MFLIIAFQFQVYYQNYNDTSTTPKLLKLPFCEEFCPFDEFKLSVEEYLPEPGLCEGQIEDSNR